MTRINEIEKWRNFIFDQSEYDLSHLNAQWVEYFDERNPKPYRFFVTYGSHCFTAKDPDPNFNSELDDPQYHSPRESRYFNLERYQLSKNLSLIIQSLNKKQVLVFHAGHGNYASVKVIDSNGTEINYLVVFSVFRERKKFRLHIHSAYPKQELGKIHKVDFLTIAYNLAHNKKLPAPRK